MNAHNFTGRFPTKKDTQYVLFKKKKFVIRAL